MLAVNAIVDLMSRIEMQRPTPEMRIAASMEDIARYLGEINQMLKDLGTRPEVDNGQLARIATAVAEIQRLVPALLQR
jgi:hypothetical protein